MHRQLEFVSLFSGAGGLDLGFELAGWHCLYASDIDRHACATLEANRATLIGRRRVMRDTVIRCEDVRGVSGSDILSAVDRKRGEIPLLLGGPPCQSWSSAGHQLGFEDPRGRLFADFVRLASELDVRWIVFENVRGLLTAKGPDGKPGSALQHIRSVLLEAGYQTIVELLNAADYGVPQRRVRLFIIGFKPGDIQPSFPKPTHHKPPAPDLLASPWLSMKSALSRIDPVREDEVILPSPSLASQLTKLKPGSGVKSPGKAEATRPGGHWGYKQGAFLADIDLPSRTVTASQQQDWIKDDQLGIRRLTPRECAALQSFPPNWKFAATRSVEYRLIGNAVPPALAKTLGQCLAKLAKTTMPPSTKVKPSDLLPLRQGLTAAIVYTMKEHRRNGPSRIAAPIKRKLRSTV